MISVENLRYRYPGAQAYALDGVSLHVAEGEFVVVAGDSGGGKSTLARAIPGLVPHFHGGDFAGTVVVAGRDTRTHQPKALADVVGFVGQHPESQSVTPRVEDEISFAMENLGVDPILMRKRVEETLDGLGLADLRDRSLETLSGGERQRVAIAAVLASQPRVLVLDEPTSQLDPQSAEDVLGVLHRLNLDLGLTIVLVEHRLDRVTQHADRMIVLGGGRVRAAGTPREVLATGAVATPLSRVGRALGWEPLPLTIREGRAFARCAPLRRAPAGTPAPAEAAHSPAATPREEALRAAPEAGAPVAISARGLRTARGGAEVLKSVSFSVHAGEIVALVGRNGSGKTTLLRTLIGLLRPYAGSRTVAGFDPAETPLERIASRVAYVPQSADALLFHDTVEDEIAFTLRARPHGAHAPNASGAHDGAHGARARGATASEVLEREGLVPFARFNPRDLSAGQRLRVALAAATAGAPGVVMLDEPTRGMDAESKERLAATLDRWRAEGVATLLVTHDVELIARAATRVILLAEGTVVIDGPVHEVLGESALFSSQMNKVFGDRRILTVEDALAAAGAR
jgi:energy-coupling factor transporter ATP-binding protein EcfA2